MGNEKKKKADEFVKKWEGRGYEKGESQSFWNGLLRDILDIERPEDFIEYEDQVLMDKSTGFIDGYIPSSKILIEQKSIEKDLNKAVKQSDGSLLTPFEQAKRYIVDLPVDRHPRWVITCNFREFHIYDMNRPGGDPDILLLKDLPKEYYRLSFITDTENVHLKKEMEISVKAGDIVGEIYDAFKTEYKDMTSRHAVESLNKLCVRLVFCLYAEDAELFKFRGQFHDYLNSYSAREMRQALIDLFKVLDTPLEKRESLYMTEDVLDFPYVNGGLFSDEDIEIPLITEKIRTLLLAKASDDFDWTEISPTIFGAVFESTLNPETRRAGGMHYTSIDNIHKVIDPLFLDELKEELAGIKELKQRKSIVDRAKAFQDKLSKLVFLDPAAGSGNFLTESYISLRRLENEALRLIYEGQMTFIDPIKVSIGQFFGIEINDFAVAVARTALWIAESQMKRATEDMFNINLEYLPLKSFPNIREANALTIDWANVVPPEDVDYIMGNPPFVGASMMSAAQKKEVTDIYGKIHLSNSVDYVGGWYYKASDMMERNSKIKAALVSTNSITQGEQVYPLWKGLINDKDIEIDFAYRTFRWDSEANLKAHVHCVIIGFSKRSTDNNKKILFESNGRKKIIENNISPYLIEAPNIIVQSTSKPLCDVPKMTKGNQPTDDGNFIFSEKEKEKLIKEDPSVEHLIYRYVGAKDYLNDNEKRYCMWLKDVDPSEYVGNDEIIRRINAVKVFREKSTAAPTRKSAETPYKFFSTPQRKTDYLIIPRVSSERRRYIPIGFMPPDVIAADSCSIVLDASLYMFGVLISNAHMAWMRTVAGRLEMRYRYSGAMVYNTFPWPDANDEQKQKIEETARMILEARKKYASVSLAQLYDPERMITFTELLKAHQQNDKAVMAAYGITPDMEEYKSEAACVAVLMKMYQKMTDKL